VSYLIVFFIAALVGTAVYLLSIREDGGSPDDGGFVDEVAPSPGGSRAFLPISTTHQDWATRLTGLLGLLVTVVVGAVVLAVSVYLSVSWIAHKISDVATNGGAPQR
jgi:hypothetical protein